jgi:hypothetical protein
VMFNCSATRFTMSCLITLNLHKFVQRFYLWSRKLSSHFYLQPSGLVLDSRPLNLL